MTPKRIKIKVRPLTFDVRKSSFGKAEAEEYGLTHRINELHTLLWDAWRKKTVSISVAEIRIRLHRLQEFRFEAERPVNG